MSFLQRSALALVLLSSIALIHKAEAQVSLYGEASLSNYGYSFNNQSLVANPDRAAFAAGFMYNARVSEHFEVGGDIHGAYAPTTVGGDKVFVSARIAYVSGSERYRTYFQLGGGEIQTKVPRQNITVGPQTVSRGAVDFAIGLDHRLTSSLDWRIFEFEAGAGSNNANGAASTSLSTGVVYSFHRD